MNIDSLINRSRQNFVNGILGHLRRCFGITVEMKFLERFQHENFSNAVNGFILIGAKIICSA